MKTIVRVLFIAVFCACIENSKQSNLTCVKLRNIDLKLVHNNGIVGAYDFVGDSWYQKLTWHDMPAGELTVHYRIEYWNEYVWVTMKERAVNIFNKKMGTEAGNIAQFVRIALGLDRCYTQMGNKSRAPTTLFQKRRCWQIASVVFDFYSHDYRIFLELIDDEDRAILSGYVAIKPMG